MRGLRIVIACSILCSLAAAAGAQTERVPPPPRYFLVVSDGIATASGGLLNNGTTIMHTMRVGAVATITGTHGIDLSAVRLQTIFPSNARLNDLEYANPEGDALILSYASLTRDRGRRDPTELALGGGIIRRQTSEPGRTRDTWIAHLGYDTDPFARRFSHLAAGVAFHIFLMESRGNSAVYAASLGLFLRIG